MEKICNITKWQVLKTNGCGNPFVFLLHYSHHRADRCVVGRTMHWYADWRQSKLISAIIKRRNGEGYERHCIEEV